MPIESYYIHAPPSETLRLENSSHLYVPFEVSAFGISLQKGLSYSPPLLLTVHLVT